MSTTSTTQAQTANGQRRKAMLGISAVCAALAVGYGLYWGLHARYFVSTDNAYVAGNVVQITPQITGTVLAIRVEDTDFVKAGDPLVKLDPADAQVALEQAEAQLGQTVREVRTLFANDATNQATVKLREADLGRVQADVNKAQEDLARRQSLTAKGAVSKEELEHAQTALALAKSAQATAEAAVVAAREQLAANRTLIDGTSVEQHPNVLRASARVRETYLALKRADLPAPVTGYVAKRSVQVGQRVPAGSPLMSIVPLDQVWVDANFKEVQLADMRIGQPVKVRADLYGSKVEYDGHIVGLGAGTGAAFALLPAQNATGNWIKVVQRVPVRVALDPKQLQAHPLRVGLSMDVTVDIHNQSGQELAAAPRANASNTTDVFSGKDTQADAMVKQIISRNIGAAAASSRAVHVARASAHAGAQASASAKSDAKDDAASKPVSNTDNSTVATVR